MESMNEFMTWPTSNMFPSLASVAPPSAPSLPLRKYPKACIVCRDRKVKCDRQLPCSTCRRWGIQNCVYPSPIRVSPRPKRSQLLEQSNAGPDRLLLERLKKLEIMVQRLGGTIDVDSSISSSGTPAEPQGGGFRSHSPEKSTNGGASSERGVGILATKDSRSRYLSSSFWVPAEVCLPMPTWTMFITLKG